MCQKHFTFLLIWQNWITLTCVASLGISATETSLNDDQSIIGLSYKSCPVAKVTLVLIAACSICHYILYCLFAAKLEKVWHWHYGFRSVTTFISAFCDDGGSLHCSFCQLSLDSCSTSASDRSISKVWNRCEFDLYTLLKLLWGIWPGWRVGVWWPTRPI